MEAPLPQADVCARCGDLAGVAPLLPSWTGDYYCEPCCHRVGGDELLQAMRADPRIELRHRVVVWASALVLLACLFAFASLILAAVTLGICGVAVVMALVERVTLEGGVVVHVQPIPITRVFAASDLFEWRVQKSHSGHLLFRPPGAWFLRRVTITYQARHREILRLSLELVAPEKEVSRRRTRKKA